MADCQDNMQRILIIGTGSIGERHLRCFLNTGRVAVGMVELRDDLRREVASRYQVDEVFSSVEAALEMSWDAAVVATPAPCHIPIARQLVEKGVNLFIEKPLSTTLDGISELIEEVDKKKLLAGVAYVWRAHPAVMAVRKKILSNRFGSPKHIIANCGQYFPHFRPAYRETYYVDRKTGGGAIQDALTHIFNLGEWLVGPIDRLCADAAHQVLDGVEVEDTVNVLTRQGDVLGSYTMNQFQSQNEMTVTVICEKGVLRIEGHNQRWGWIDDPTGEWKYEQFEIKERDDWFTRQEEAYLDALDGKIGPLCTLEEGFQTLKVNLAAIKSADNNSGWENVKCQ